MIILSYNVLEKYIGEVKRIYDLCMFCLLRIRIFANKIINEGNGIFKKKPLAFCIHSRL